MKLNKKIWEENDFFSNMNKIGLIITIGGNSVKKDFLIELIDNVRKSNFKSVYLIYRNDISYFKEEISKNLDVFKKVIEIKDKSIKKIGKIKEIIKYVEEDYVKIIDPDDFTDLDNLKKIDLNYKKKSDFIIVSMIALRRERKKAYFDYCYRGPNPSTITLTEHVKVLNEFDIEYDEIYYEDMFRYLLSSLSALLKNNEIILERKKIITGIYYLSSDGMSDIHSFYKNNSLFRIEVIENVNIKWIETMLNDLAKNSKNISSEFYKNINVKSFIDRIITTYYALMITNNLDSKKIDIKLFEFLKMISNYNLISESHIDYFWNEKAKEMLENIREKTNIKNYLKLASKFEKRNKKQIHKKYGKRNIKKYIENNFSE